jgi:hypothetical protein
LAELEAKERAMYELVNGKDQTMTVLKLALANLGMWVRDHYFPATYAHATWYRLAPFFRLAGRVSEEKHAVLVELRPFNDRQLTRDLSVICERVMAAKPRLHDGRRLCFTIKGTGHLAPQVHQCEVGEIPCIARQKRTCDIFASAADR